MFRLITACNASSVSALFLIVHQRSGIVLSAGKYVCLALLMTMQRHFWLAETILTVNGTNPQSSQRGRRCTALGPPIYIHMYIHL
jgi:hypothetical protein